MKLSASLTLALAFSLVRPARGQGWTKEGWPRSDASVRSLRLRLDALSLQRDRREARRDLLSEMARFRALAKNQPSPSVRFGLAYSIYLIRRSKPVPARVPELDRARAAVLPGDRGDFEWTRLRYLLDPGKAPDALRTLGTRLLAKEPGDFWVAVTHVPRLDPQESSEQRKAALALTKDLVTRYPDFPGICGLRAGVLLRAGQVERNWGYLEEAERRWAHALALVGEDHPERKNFTYFLAQVRRKIRTRDWNVW